MYYNIKWTVVCEGSDPAVEEKKRISVRIAGRFLSVVTDEDQASVREIETRLNDRIKEMGQASPRMTTREGKIDAVILCAFDALNRERTADRRIADAEKRAEEAERKYRLLREEFARVADGGAARGPEFPELEPDPDGAEYEHTIGLIRERLTEIRDRGKEDQA